MLDQGRQQYGAIIGDGEISGFVGFDIYIYIYFFFLLVFLVLLCMGFLVFDFFFCAIFFSQI